MSAGPRPTIAEAIVGGEVGPLSQAIDARWLMAYAAGLGETDSRYYDTLASGGPLAHPLFAVCYEWPVALLSRAKTIDAALAPLSVHATHDAVVHRPPRAGEILITSAKVVAVSRRRSGTLVTTRFTTVDERGAPVTTTDYGSVYRGVDLGPAAHEPASGGGGLPRSDTPTSLGSRPPPDTDRVRWREVVAVSAQASHVYTECARIWNPIHTDVAVAKAAGLPAPILHGTATPALAVSRVVAHDLGGDPARVRRIAARFTGMVLMPSTFIVRGLELRDGVIAFDAVSPDARRVLSDSRLIA